MAFSLLGMAGAAVGVPAVSAAPVTDNQRVIARCITAAADVHRLPPAMIVVLLHVEGGELGRVSGNTNDTVDIGPMQVNQIWVPDVAAHWHASRADTYRALRDDFCANVEAGAWILRQGLDAAHGDFWQGVGYYHSHDPGHHRTYLRSVLAQVLRLRALDERALVVAAERADPTMTRAAAATSRAGTPVAPILAGSP